MLDRLLHPKLKASPRSREEARAFLVVHAGAGLFGLAIAAGWIAVLRPASALEIAGALSLLLPFGLAAAIPFSPRLGLLQILSSGASVLCLSLFSLLTGGLLSPFLPWLLLVPAEASLTRRSRHLIAVLVFAVAAILGLGLVQATELLPQTRLPAGYQAPIMTLSLVCGLLYGFALLVHMRQMQDKEVRRRAMDEAASRFLAEHAKDYVFRVANAETVVFASDNAGELFDGAAASLLGRDLGALMPTSVRPRLKHALVRAGYFGESMSLDAVIAGELGAPRCLRLQCHPLDSIAKPRRPGPRKFDLHSPAGDVLVVCEDVTDTLAQTERLKADRAAAVAESRAKSHFLANMSHELRTPLNSILGFAQMIEAEMFGRLGHEKYKEYAGLIEESGRFLLELINDILDLSKIEAGKYQLDCGPVNLAQALERSLRLMMPQYREKGIALTVRVAPDLSLALADPKAVRQILFNLLSNALKFTPKDGQVTVSLDEVEGRIVLSVLDTGVGMSKADLGRLAKPFEQVAAPIRPENDERSRAEIGTGLGLALVRSLAELHNGSFRIDSRLGEGTCVRIGLPIAGPAEKMKDIAAAA